MEIPTDIEHWFSEYLDLDFYFTEDDLDDLEFIVHEAVDDQMDMIKEKAIEMVDRLKEEIARDPELQEEYGIKGDDDD